MKNTCFYYVFLFAICAESAASSVIFNNANVSIFSMAEVTNGSSIFTDSTEINEFPSILTRPFEFSRNVHNQASFQNESVSNTVLAHADIELNFFIDEQINNGVNQTYISGFINNIIDGSVFSTDAKYRPSAINSTNLFLDFSIDEYSIIELDVASFSEGSVDIAFSFQRESEPDISELFFEVMPTEASFNEILSPGDYRFVVSSDALVFSSESSGFNQQVGGTFDMVITPTVVPLPAVLPLFLSGLGILLGTLFVRNRK